jgi:predicted DNA-binding protein with PD1-like motif
VLGLWKGRSLDKCISCFWSSYLGIELVAKSDNEDDIMEALKNIAAAHTIIVTAVTGMGTEHVVKARVYGY